jgi:hypothetical protein
MIRINPNSHVIIDNRIAINNNTITLSPGAALTYNNRTFRNNGLNDLTINLINIETSCKPNDFEFMLTDHDDDNDESAPLIGIDNSHAIEAY